MTTDERYFITVLDENDEEVAVIDDYLSLVWTKRYSDAGDFVLELPIEYFGREYIKVDYTLILPGFEGFMIVEDMNPVWDPDMGVKLSLTGSSGEKLLESRVTQEEILMEGAAFSYVSNLIDQNIRAPAHSPRAIERWRPSISTAHTNPTIDEYFEPDLVYNIIRGISKACGWGFQLALRKNLVGGFEHVRFRRLEIYQGLDRTVNQVSIPPVIFSEDFENIHTADYQIKTSHEKTVAEVLTGDEDPLLQRFSVYSSPEPSGRNRKEFIVQATDLRTDDEDMTPEIVEDIAIHRGLEALEGQKALAIFDAKVDITDGPFKIGINFNLGDFVTCYISGIPMKARVVEHIRTVDNEGFSDFIGFDFGINEYPVFWRDGWAF